VEKKKKRDAPTLSPLLAGQRGKDWLSWRKGKGKNTGTPPAPTKEKGRIGVRAEMYAKKGKSGRTCFSKTLLPLRRKH